MLALRAIHTKREFFLKSHLPTDAPSQPSTNQGHA
jgi:hypothetical protein